MLKENGGFQSGPAGSPGSAARPCLRVFGRPPRFRMFGDERHEFPARSMRPCPAGTSRARAAHQGSRPLRTTRSTTSPVPRRVLDPLERTSEILFGIIMVLTFTGSIRVADAGREDLRTVLAGAIGCNLAWGLVDAAMYLMATFIARARFVAALGAIRRCPPSPRRHTAIIDEILPSAALGGVDDRPMSRLLRQRLNRAVVVNDRDADSSRFPGSGGRVPAGVSVDISGRSCP